MTDDRSLERAARSWIEAGPTQAPDRAVEAALLRIQTLPQERDLRIPWRLPKMNGATRFALAAVAVVAVAFGGLYFLGPAPNGVGVPSPTATPTAIPTATPIPFPTDTSGGVPVAPGTYALDLPAQRVTTGTAVGIRITFTVPAGWEKNLTPTVLWNAVDHRTFGFFTVNNLYVDPCGPENVGLLDPPLGPTVDDLVAGLRRLPRMTWTDKGNVTIDGFAGKQLEVSAPLNPTPPCPSGEMWLWASPESGPLPDAGAPIGPGDRRNLTIVDVDGARLVITPGTSPDADLQGILDSVRIATIAPAPSGAPSPSP